MIMNLHFFLCNDNTEQTCIEQNLFASTEKRPIKALENDLCLLYNFSEGKKIVYGIWSATNDNADETHSNIWKGEYPNRIKVKPLNKEKPISISRAEIKEILNIKNERIFPPEIQISEVQRKQLFKLFKIKPTDNLDYAANSNKVNNDKTQQSILSNQGNITELVFKRESKEILTYNEMKFGSKAEIEIAKELEKRDILFFPLPFAVRGNSNGNYKNHREPDFLICLDGVWGILEVAYHTPERYEKDREKSMWFKKSGILCIEHYPSEKCLKNPKEVLDEFVDILKKHKR